MPLLNRWVLPIAFAAIGIAIFTGTLFPRLPSGSGLRTLLGLVVILLAVHRFVASRTRPPPARRFGGGRNRPWENREER